MVQAQGQEKQHLVFYAFIGFISGFTFLVLPFFWLLFKYTVKIFAGVKPSEAAKEAMNPKLGGGPNLGD